MANVITNQAENYLEALICELEIPLSRYEQADKSYKSLGEWLHRPQSKVQHLAPDIYVQGSFRLGTVIKPISSDEQYDIDSVCVLEKLEKSNLSQAALKILVGEEIKLYRQNRNLTNEVQEGRRCWTLEYADGAQFHMDIVPSLLNGKSQRLLLESHGMDAQWSDTAIAITDNEVPNYYDITDEWPRSNPKGFAKWFISRMGEVFVRRREMILNEMRAEDLTASIEDIPDYRVRTPLQSAIMILKRHRDIMFKAKPKVKPISIVLSTLSAHSYQGEKSIGEALLSILNRMEERIEYDGEKHIIRNPTDPLENFADKWIEFPERKEAFFNWLSQARSDFGQVTTLVEYRQMSSVLSDRMGGEFTDAVTRGAALQQTKPSRSSLLRSSTAASAATVSDVTFPSSPRIPKKPDGFA